MMKYPKYKKTEIQWMEVIPEHWEVERLGTYFRERRVKVSEIDYAGLSVTKKGVVPRLENVALSNNLNNRKLVIEGDFVINSRSDRKGSSGIAFQNGSVAVINIVLKPILINIHFANFLLKSRSFVEENYRIGKGIVADLWTTKYSQMKNHSIPIPPLNEQQAIADYLEEKCAQIDQAQTEKKQLIALLKEQKKAIIQKAVTQGLDDSVALKDTDIPWLGEIPEHWEVRKLKTFGMFSKGGGFSKSDLSESGSLAILYGDIYTRYNIKIDNIERYIEPSKLKKKNIVRKGDLLFTGSGELREDIGKCVEVNVDEAFAGGDVNIFAQKKHNSRYISYLMNSENYINEKARKSKGHIVIHIYNSTLKNLPIPIPPISEQEAIAQYLDEECGKIDEAIQEIETLCERLKEYKTILIDQVVRGQIKVC